MMIENFLQHCRFRTIFVKVYPARTVSIAKRFNRFRTIFVKVYLQCIIKIAK